jgi:hypothetical protein
MNLKETFRKCKKKKHQQRGEKKRIFWNESLLKKIFYEPRNEKK